MPIQQITIRATITGFLQVFGRFLANFTQKTGSLNNFLNLFNAAFTAYPLELAHQITILKTLFVIISVSSFLIMTCRR